MRLLLCPPNWGFFFAPPTPNQKKKKKLIVRGLRRWYDPIMLGTQILNSRAEGIADSSLEQEANEWRRQAREQLKPVLWMTCTLTQIQIHIAPYGVLGPSTNLCKCVFKCLLWSFWGYNRPNDGVPLCYFPCCNDKNQVFLNLSFFQFEGCLLVCDSHENKCQIIALDSALENQIKSVSKIWSEKHVDSTSPGINFTSFFN